MTSSSASGWAIDAVPVFADNYVWVLNDGADAIVVDPGDAMPVAVWLQARGLRPVSIVATHHHADHVGGIAELKRQWPAASCLAPYDDRIAIADLRVGEGDSVRLHDGLPAFDVMSIPGHTSTHIALVGDGLLFCGDTLFSAGCGRMFEGTAAQMLASLDRLAALPDATLVCCGHEYTAANCRFALVAEPANAALQRFRETTEAKRARDEGTLPSSIGVERAVNPFLRVDSADVRESLRVQRQLPALATRIEAFAELRRWKDGFHG